MFGFAVLATTLVTLAAGKKHGAASLRAAKVEPMAVSTNYTSLSMIGKDGKLTGNGVSDECLKYVVANAGNFVVPFGQEKAFLKEFKAQCKGAVIQTVVTQKFDETQNTACTDKKQSYRFYHDKAVQTLGDRIKGNNVAMHVIGQITCAGKPVLYVGDKNGKCATPADASTVGSVSVTPVAASILSVADWKYQDVIMDLSACTITGAVEVAQEETLAVNGASSLLAVSGIALLAAVAPALF